MKPIVITTHQIRGKGRGLLLGYPTINMAIVRDLSLPDGIYAAWVTIAGKQYKGALHFGPIPTYREKEKSLEVFLLDVDDARLGETYGKQIGLEIAKRLRDIQSFDSSAALAAQIAKDVNRVRDILR